MRTSSLILLGLLVIATVTSPRFAAAEDVTDVESEQDLNSDVPCQDELAFAPAAYALRIHPAFRNFDFIRNRIEQAREYGQPYNTAGELDLLDQAFARVQEGGNRVYEARGRVAALLNSGEDNLIREYKAHADQVDKDLRRNALVAEENGDLEHRCWLTELIARVAHYRKGISIERGAWFWQHARYEASQILDRRSTMPEWIWELRESIPKVSPHPTDGDFEFAMNLGAVNFVLGQNALRFALQRAYLAAPPADESLIWGERMAPAPKLNRALSIFLAPPRLRTHGAWVSLEGPVMINEVITTVNVRFDPRLRFFTVRSGQDDGPGSLFYQLTIDDDGLLHFVDNPPLTAEAASHRLDLTHFAY